VFDRFVQRRDRVAEDQDALEKSSDTPQRQLLSEQLQDGRARAQQETIEIAGLDRVAELIEPAADRIGNRKRHGDHPVQQRHLRQGPAPELPEEIEQHPHGDEFHRGDEERADRLQDK